MKLRQISVVVQDILSEGGRELSSPTRRVAACGVLHNPLAGKAPTDDFSEVVDISVEAGEILTKRALDALEDMNPRGYGKGVIVGSAGDLEHGAAMIHVRVGLPMRRQAGGGPALIPGNAKVGTMGSSIDIIFGGMEDSWDYDAMDTLTIAIPDAPKPDEILLVIAFLGGTRPNARIKGNPPEQVVAFIEKQRAS